MNHKKPFKSETPQPVYLHTAKINGYTVNKGMEVSLIGRVGYPAGRYRFEYVEQNADGSEVLNFFGPSRRKAQKYRTVWPGHLDEIRTVHVKTR